MFKTGDKLICINNTNVIYCNLKIDNIYTVRSSDADYVMLYEFNSNYIFMNDRFKIDIKETRKIKLEKLQNCE